MALVSDGSVAEVAKSLTTELAFDIIKFAFLLNNPTTTDVGAKDTKFEIDPFDVFVAMFFYDFLSNLKRQQSSYITVVIWFLLVMLLTFGWCITGPAKVLETFGTLDLRTSRFYFSNGYAAF